MNPRSLHCALNRTLPSTDKRTAILARTLQIATMVALVVLLGHSAGLPAMPPESRAFFAEPTTGRRVTEYSVDLPLNRGERKTYSIPAECATINRMVDQGLAYTGRILDRRLWEKVGEDCWFDGFLNRHPVQEITDYVSNYDFMNARLDDFPIDFDCGDDSVEQIDPDCQPKATDERGLLRHFPLAEPLSDAEQTGKTDCVLRDGLFYGHLHVDEKGVRCDIGMGAPSLRLITINYADINGDGFLDAVLRFVPIGPGAARSPLILPLTRKEPQGGFSVPEPPPLDIAE